MIFFKILLFIPKSIFITTHLFYLKYFKREELEIFNPFLIITAVIFGNLLSIDIMLANLNFEFHIHPLYYLFFGLIFSFIFIYSKENYVAIMTEFSLKNNRQQKTIKKIGFTYILISFILFLIATAIYTDPNV
jgi:hypothetical protein